MPSIEQSIREAYNKMLIESTDKKKKADTKLDDGDGMDPVGQGDADIDNDGDTDSSDEYLAKKRKAIAKTTSEGKTEDDEDEEDDYEDEEDDDEDEEDDEEDDDKPKMTKESVLLHPKYGLGKVLVVNEDQSVDVMFDAGILRGLELEEKSRNPMNHDTYLPHSETERKFVDMHLDNMNIIDKETAPAPAPVLVDKAPKRHADVEDEDQDEYDEEEEGMQESFVQHIARRFNDVHRGYIEESVEINSDMYETSHSMKPSGKSSWTFSPTDPLGDDFEPKDAIMTPNMKYNEAKKWVSKKTNATTLYLLP